MLGITCLNLKSPEEWRAISGLLCSEWLIVFGSDIRITRHAYRLLLCLKAKRSARRGLNKSVLDGYCVLPACDG